MQRLEFRTRVALSPDHGLLGGHLTPGCRARRGDAGQHGAGRLGDAQPKSQRLGENKIPDPRQLFGPAEHLEQPAGPVLLHHAGQKEDIERPFPQQHPKNPAYLLPREMIDIGLQHHDPLKPRSVPCQKQGAQAVDRGQLHGAKSQPRTLEASGRTEGELIDDPVQQQRARGRDELPLKLGRVHGLALQEDRCRRGGQGHEPVGAANRSGKPRHAGTGHPAHVKRLQRPEGSDHVNQGVHGSDLVKMDLVQGAAMHAGLNLSQTRKGVLGAQANGL